MDGLPPRAGRPARVAAGGLALAAALLAPSAARLEPAAAQEKERRPAAEPKRDPKGGRIPMLREQGSAAELKALIEGLLTAMRERSRRGERPGPRDPRRPPPPPDERRDEKRDERRPDERRDEKRDERRPDERRDERGPKEGEKKVDPVLATLRSFAPTKEAIIDAFEPEGIRAIGKRLLKASQEIFAGDSPPAILNRLGIRPSYTKVEVFQASTEDLVTMELGTVAAREFASGLRRTARVLKQRYQWYVVVFRKPIGGPAEKEAEKGDDDDPPLPADARLQIWFKHEGRYVLLGRVWRLDG